MQTDYTSSFDNDPNFRQASEWQCSLSIDSSLGSVSHFPQSDLKRINNANLSNSVFQNRTGNVREHAGNFHVTPVNS